VKQLSDDRMSHLSHKIWETLNKEGLVSYQDTQKALISFKKHFRQFFDVLASIDQRVRQKIETLKRGVPEGSREWDILHRQYFDEEVKKLRF